MIENFPFAIHNELQTGIISFIACLGPGIIGFVLNWLVWGQCGLAGKCGLQLLSQHGSMYNYVSRSIPEICTQCCMNIKQPQNNDIIIITIFNRQRKPVQLDQVKCDQMNSAE